ncbi:MAG: nucleoside triphosphate pyrophosphohydrolase [Gammaproteobacteria bacterium]|nr:nucleoside triphosphate pyrophosphohydrolase [Gammaproteobacteria bacterium]
MNQIEKLLEVMAKLRDPAGGCPWDLEQDYTTIAPHTIEEAYEVADAIERDDRRALCDELGDLLFQVVFHAQLASEEGAFSFDDVVRRLNDKMIRRHPHVFADACVSDSQAQTEAWEQQKAAERRATGASVMDDVPRSLPALRRADKIAKRAASVGFDWPDVTTVRAKVDEELGELDEAIAAGDQPGMEWEIGDLLCAVANLGRHLGVDNETVLQQSNNRFISRFRHMEENSSDHLSGFDLEQLERLWQKAKLAEKAQTSR